MSNSPQRTIEIVDPEHIAATLSGLTDVTYNVTICFSDSPLHYPVSVVYLERDRHFFMLTATNLVDVVESLTAHRPFTLHARQTSESLCFDVSEFTEVVQRGERVSFKCAIPGRLQISRQRDAFRAPLGADMCVTVLVRTHANVAPIAARLRNLSLGGCLLELPSGEAGAVEPGQRLHRLDALFPDGSNFNVTGQVQHVQYNESSGSVLLGIEFQAETQEFERRLWYFVREIERETARREARSRHMILPSPLFQPLATEKSLA